MRIRIVRRRLASLAAFFIGAAAVPVLVALIIGSAGFGLLSASSEAAGPPQRATTIVEISGYQLVPNGHPDALAAQDRIRSIATSKGGGEQPVFASTDQLEISATIPSVELPTTLPAPFRLIDLNAVAWANGDFHLIGSVIEGQADEGEQINGRFVEFAVRTVPRNGPLDVIVSATQRTHKFVGASLEGRPVLLKLPRIEDGVLPTNPRTVRWLEDGVEYFARGYGFADVGSFLDLVRELDLGGE